VDGLRRGIDDGGFWWKSQFLRWQALILIAITVGKVFIYIRLPWT